MCDALLMNVTDAARKLGLGRSITYELIRAGQLRSVKIGGARRVLVSDLADFVSRLESDPEGAVVELE